jgi:hypothetical protein
MKKIIIACVCVSLVAASCSIFHKEKYGCPGSPGPNGKTMDQKIASGENVKQSKFKVQH